MTTEVEDEDVAGKADKGQLRPVTLKNELKDWLLINNMGVRARHKIEEYHDV